MLKSSFTKEETNQIKGIALLLLLFHHLFYNQNGLYTEFYIGNAAIVSNIAKLCKVCVGIFVFFSGYGLFQSQKGKMIGLKSFYLKSFTKLYLNYWLIWLLFVPIAIFLFNYTPANVYEEHIFLKFIINVLGLQDAFRFKGYNATWWFMTCILLLYFIYPYLKVLLEKFDWIIPVLFFIFSLFSISISFLGTHPYAPIADYLFTFILGMFWAKQNNFVRVNKKVKNRWISLFFVFISFDFCNLASNFIEY